MSEYLFLIINGASLGFQPRNTTFMDQTPCGNDITIYSLSLDTKGIVGGIIVTNSTPKNYTTIETDYDCNHNVGVKTNSKEMNTGKDDQTFCKYQDKLLKFWSNFAKGVNVALVPNSNLKDEIEQLFTLSKVP